MDTLSRNSEVKPLDPATSQALIAFLQTAGDDELILGQRSSEWLGMAPDLEEDIAFSSICQDELGHAMFYFGLLEILGQGSVDDLAFRRTAEERLSTRLVELENRDFAFTVTRNYLYELFDEVRLEAALNSTFKPLADGARKIVREEYYHLLHLESIITKLAAVGGEATEKVHAAINTLWPYLADLCSLEDGSGRLRDAGILAKSENELYDDYRDRLKEKFERLQLPWQPLPQLQSRRTDCSNELLQELLAQMNEVSGTVQASDW